MLDLSLHPFMAADIPALMALQRRYAAAYPGAPLIPGDAYLGPGFHGGDDVVCCVGDQGQLVGYAVVFAYLAQGASDAPHTVWAEVRVDPALAEPLPVREPLFAWVVQRARALTQDAPDHPVHLCFQHFPVEMPSIAFVTGKGCVHTENVYQMARDLAQPLAPVAPPAAVTLLPWRMPSEAEQRRYLQARNAAFPEAPLVLADWQYFMRSPLWAVGTTFTAFTGDDPLSSEVVGSVLVYWDAAEQLQALRKVGYTETIFVLPPWRSRGIARALVTTALAHLRAQGLDEARLEVRAQNEDALRLYRGLGFVVVRQSGFYMLKLSQEE